MDGAASKVADAFAVDPFCIAVDTIHEHIELLRKELRAYVALQGTTASGGPGPEAGSVASAAELGPGPGPAEDPIRTPAVTAARRKLLEACDGLGSQLSTVEAVIAVTARDPERYAVSTEELARREAWLLQLQNEEIDIRAVIDGRTHRRRPSGLPPAAALAVWPTAAAAAAFLQGKPPPQALLKPAPATVPAARVARVDAATPHPAQNTPLVPHLADFATRVNDFLRPYGLASIAADGPPRVIFLVVVPILVLTVIMLTQVQVAMSSKIGYSSSEVLNVGGGGRVQGG